MLNQEDQFALEVMRLYHNLEWYQFARINWILGVWIVEWERLECWDGLDVPHGRYWKGVIREGWSYLWYQALDQEHCHYLFS